VDRASGSGPDAALDRETRSGWVIAVVAALCLVAVTMVGLVALGPGLLVALVPGWLTGPASVGRTLLAVGALALLLPVVAALVAHLRGRSRAAGWFVVLTLLAVVPAAVAINRGASEVRQANEADSPASEPCAEYSGGDTRCPGG